MKIEVKSKESFVTTDWSGGTTTEMLLLPPDGSYAKRDFKVRVSSASVLEETSVFSQLDGIRRYLSLLRGRMTLTFQNRRKVAVRPYEVVAFSGSEETRSEGTCTDFNLMLKGCGGKLVSFDASKGAEISCRPGCQYICYSESLCCLDTVGKAKEGGPPDPQQAGCLQRGSLLLVREVQSGEKLRFHAPGAGSGEQGSACRVLCAEIEYEGPFV